MVTQHERLVVIVVRSMVYHVGRSWVKVPRQEGSPINGLYGFGLRGGLVGGENKVPRQEGSLLARAPPPLTFVCRGV